MATSSSSTSSQSSSDSSSHNKRRKAEKKRQSKKAGKKKKREISPSVSHPKNRNRLKKIKPKKENTQTASSKPQNVKENTQTASSEPQKVMPLLLKNVKSHTKVSIYNVDKEDTVEQFLHTINAVEGKYSLVDEPSLSPIPTPQPWKAPEKKKNKKNRTKSPVKESSNSSSDSEDTPDDSGMHTMTSSHKAQETRLPQNKAETELSAKREAAAVRLEEEDFAPLDSNALREKFQALVHIGRKQYKTEETDYKEEFNDWCRKNGYWTIRQREKFNKPAQQDKPANQKKSKLKQKQPIIDLPVSTPTLLQTVVTTSNSASPPKHPDNNSFQQETTSAETDEPPEPFVHQNPVLVSQPIKSVSFQPEPARYEPKTERKLPFKTPDVLKLDSYTQTNDKERLSTKTILCSATAPTFLSGNEMWPDGRATRGVQTGLVRAFSMKLPSQYPEEVESFEPVEFTLKENCRHGNNRKSCQLCQSSIIGVSKKPHRPTPQPDSTQPNSSHNSENRDVPLVEKPDIPSYPVLLQKTTRKKEPVPLRMQPSRVQPSRAVPPGVRSPPPAYSDDESIDSGNDSDTPDQIVVSEPKLMPRLLRIKNLARAKLKQIKHKDMREESLERPHSTAVKPPVDSSRKKKGIKVDSDGNRLFTLNDLPPLVSTTMSETLQQVQQLKEHKRDTDVNRARKFIKHCLDTPVSTELYQHQHRDIPRSYDGTERLPYYKGVSKRSGSEATNRIKSKSRGIAEDVASRKCVSEIPDGKLNRFDVNYKAYIHALERIIDSNLSSLMHAEINQSNHSASNM